MGTSMIMRAAIIRSVATRVGKIVAFVVSLTTVTLKNLLAKGAGGTATASVALIGSVEIEGPLSKL